MGARALGAWSAHEWAERSAVLPDVLDAVSIFLDEVDARPASSGLHAREQSDARNSLRRFTVACIANGVARKDVVGVLAYLLERTPDGGWRRMAAPSDHAFRAFLSEVRRLADKAAIPEER